MKMVSYISCCYYISLCLAYVCVCLSIVLLLDYKNIWDRTAIFIKFVGHTICHRTTLSEVVLYDIDKLDLQRSQLRIDDISEVHKWIVQTVRDMEQVTVGIKQEVIHQLSKGMLTFYLYPFLRSKSRSCIFSLQISGKWANVIIANKL